MVGDGNLDFKRGGKKAAVPKGSGNSLPWPFGPHVCLFYSFICNPLHVARRAMAAAVPLPSRGQRRGFYTGIPFSGLEPACAVIVRYPQSPSSLIPPEYKISAPRKEQRKSTF